ncbi:unnamed protein product [Symbiodinium natans]|uniref:Uncharacterized protein n=1 Tax=Symbiodinium natans TaxID=878477 RepID=A0A812QDC2_9DINO|nr:unnamed protein product [Symbiodinium natans]
MESRLGIRMPTAALEPIWHLPPVADVSPLQVWWQLVCTWRPAMEPTIDPDVSEMADLLPPSTSGMMIPAVPAHLPAAGDNSETDEEDGWEFVNVSDTLLHAVLFLWHMQIVFLVSIVHMQLCCFCTQHRWH